jgi:ABC-type ATPase with predicted acetyltransferase domain
MSDIDRGNVKQIYKRFVEAIVLDKSVTYVFVIIMYFKSGSFFEQFGLEFLHNTMHTRYCVIYFYRRKVWKNQKRVLLKSFTDADINQEHLFYFFTHNTITRLSMEL